MDPVTVSGLIVVGALANVLFECTMGTSLAVLLPGQYVAAHVTPVATGRSRLHCHVDRRGYRQFAV